MKCPYCGGEVGDNVICQYCGSKQPYNNRREQEKVNMSGCPKCHSSNIEFNREKEGEVYGTKTRSVIRRTIGFCKDCGYTWYPNNAYGSNSVLDEEKRKKNMILWILGWICFFPAPLMVLIWREKNPWPKKKKIIVTIIFWVVFFIIGLSGGSE